MYVINSLLVIICEHFIHFFKVVTQQTVFLGMFHVGKHEIKFSQPYFCYFVIYNMYINMFTLLEIQYQPLNER